LGDEEFNSQGPEATLEEWRRIWRFNENGAWFSLIFDFFGDEFFTYVRGYWFVELGKSGRYQKS